MKMFALPMLKSAFVILTSFILSTLCAAAQTDSISVFIPVVNAFTGEIVEDGEVDVLRPDSSFVSKGEFVYSTDDGVRHSSLISFAVPENGEYLLYIKHKSYFSAYFPVKIKVSKRSDGFCILSETIKLHKRPKSIADTQLGEAVVTTTKIKMVMKGDTIVYNADAFSTLKGFYARRTY